MQSVKPLWSEVLRDALKAWILDITALQGQLAADGVAHGPNWLIELLPLAPRSECSTTSPDPNQSEQTTAETSGVALQGSISTPALPQSNAHAYQVRAYSPAGELLASTAVQEDSHYALRLPSGSRGLVLLAVGSTSEQGDTWQPQLRALTELEPTSPTSVHISPITELVTRHLGLAAGAVALQATGITAPQLVQANQQVADALGLGTNDSSAASPRLSHSAEDEGLDPIPQAQPLVIAAIAGAALQANQDTVLDDLAAGIQEDGLSPAASALLASGAEQAAVALRQALPTSTATIALASEPATWSLDVDGDGQVQLDTDLAMVMRKLLGTGSAGDLLLPSAPSSTATRRTAADLHRYLEAGIQGKHLDVDGDGSITALGDALMILRRLQTRASGNDLITGLISAASPEIGLPEAGARVAARIDGLMPPPAALSISGITSTSITENTVYTSTTPEVRGAIGTVSWSLEGPDASLFSVTTSTGLVTMAARDFENPRDSGANNVYNVTLKATDANGNSASQAIAITVTNVAEGAPTFTSGTTAAFAENGTGAVYTAAATANAGGAISYSLSGTDAALFNLNASTGALAFKNAPDFEAPTDGGANNIYDVIITANEAGNTSTATRNLTITIADVSEGPTGPVLQGFTRSGAVDVSSDLQVGFAAPIARGKQGNVKLWKKSGELIETFNAATSTALTFSDRSLTINPLWNLDGSNDYYLTIDPGAVEGANGGAFNGVSDASILTFQSDVELRGALGSTDLRDLFPGTSAESIGNHSALFIRATFPDLNRAPGSLADAQADMNDVAQFFAENSRGRMSLTTTYTPIVTLDFAHQWESAYDGAGKGIDGLDAIQRAARQAALELGFDSNQFNVTVVRVDKALRDGASYGGGDSVWLAWGGSGTAAHEIGHALNLGHSNSTTWNGGSTEYGSSVDCMGTGDTGPDHFEAPKKISLGWIDSNDILVDPGPGIYRIHAADQFNQVAGRIDQFKQQIPRDQLGANPTITLEYRPAQGGLFKDSLVLSRNGLVVKEGSGQYDPVDLYVTLGKTFNVPGSDTYLTVLAKGEGYLDVAYQQGPFSGNAAPSAAFTATASSVKRFDTVTFSADAMDADGDPCIYRWSFSDGVVGVGPTFTRSFHQSAQGNVTVTLDVSDLRGGLATLTGTLAAGAASTTGSLSVGTITPPTFAQPRVSVVATDAFAAEGGDAGVFTISRIGAATTNPLTVNISWSGSDLADFTGLPSRVTIPGGQTSVAVTVTPTDDATVEAIKTLALAIVADASYTISNQNSAASSQVGDNDLTVVTVSTVDGAASEADRDMGMFRIERTGSTAQPLTVYYGITGTAYNGADYGRLDGQVVIQAGQSFATVAIVPLVDAEGEPEETVTLTLASFNDAYSVGAASTGRVTINDTSSSPTISVSNTYEDAIVTEGGTAKIVFTANGGSGGPVDVQYTIRGTASSGSDFTPQSGTITLPTGGSNTVTLAIPILADGINENDESLVLMLSPAASYSLGLDTSTQITILEPINTANGGDRVRVSRWHEADPEETGSTPASFYLYRDSTDANRQALTVTYTLSGTATPGADYSGEVQRFDGTVLSTFTPSASNSVTIPANADAVIIRLIPVDDTVAEGAETIAFRIASVSGGAVIGSNATTGYVLTDNDTSATLVGFQKLSSLWQEERNPANNIHALTVSLNQAAPTGGVQVAYRPDGGTALGHGIDWIFVDQNGNDMPAMNGVLEFAAGETSKSIRVRVVNDRITESQENFTILLENAVGASLQSGASRHTVTLYDVIPDGLVMEERWAGGSVFTDNSWDTSPVSYTGYLDGFTSAQNAGDNFSRRLTGFITAPATGQYTFYASGDDAVRLYVGTSDAPSNKVLAASVPSGGWTGYQQWDKYTSQQSTAISLVAGRKYYVEVQHQEGGGGDHVSIGWTGPGITAITPITTAAAPASVENRYVRFLTSASTATEGQALTEPILVSIDRVNDTGTITVNLDVVAAASTAGGSDYTLGSSTITFAPGETVKAVDITALGDSVNEAAERVELRLASANGARIIGPSTHALTIVDATAPVLSPTIGLAKRGDGAGALVGQIAATFSAGRNLGRWEILAGNPRVEGSATPAFTIDSEGRITVANPAALPLTSLEIALTIQVSDHQGSSALALVPIIINGQQIKEERWNSKNTYGAGAWSTAPATSSSLPAFDAPRDVADNYSRRISGVFTPPSSGAFSFWIAARDVGRLTLAPADDPTQEIEIASSGDVEYQAWTTTDSQQSAPQQLVAGRRYLLRAYQQEGIWGDHLSVAWSGPGIERQVIPASACLDTFSDTRVGPAMASDTTPATVAASTLASTAVTNTGLTATIKEGDVTRDNTLGLNGTAVAGAVVRIYDGSSLISSTTATADGNWSLTTPALADGNHTFRAEVIDGSGNVALTTTRSFTVRSTMPVGASVQLVSKAIGGSATAAGSQAVGNILAVRSIEQGVITYEVLTDSPFTEQRWSGSSAYDTNTWDSATAAYTGTLSMLTTAQNVGNNYSRRITGWITAPATGDYTFTLSSDDQSKLFLSTDDTAAHKRTTPIASVGGWTDFEDWNAGGKSAAITLQAGQRYYVEVQHLEGGGGDHVSVGWTGPGISTISRISVPSNLMMADLATGAVQLVSRGVANATTAAGVPITYGGTSPDGRYVVFGSSQVTAFGTGGTPFTDSSALAGTPTTDLFVYDRTTQAVRLVTAGASATSTRSRQATFVGISADSRSVVYTTDYVENIGGFSAPGKPAASTWSLVDGGYPDATGKLKSTAVRVADIDPTKLAIQLSGGYISTDGQSATVSAVTIKRPSAGKLTFWVQGTLENKAVKLELEDRSSGILVKATTAKYGAATGSDWETTGTLGSVATSLDGAGYGVSLIEANGSNLTAAMQNEGAVASRDVVAFDLATGTQTLLSHSAASGHLQSQAGDVRTVTLSTDGRHVLFTAADAQRFGNGGTAFTDPAPAVTDLFATDLQTGKIRLLSHTAASATTSAGVTLALLGTTANGWAVFSAADASAFGFTDSATGTADLIAVSLAEGTTKLITRSGASTPAASAGVAVTVEQIAGDHVYFTANDATAFGFSSDADTSRADLFRFTPTTGVLELLSHASPGTTGSLAGNYRAGSLRVSPNGRYMAFVLNMQASGGGFSVAVNGDALFIADTQSGAIRLVNASNAEGSTLSYTAWADAHNQPMFFTPDSSALVWQTHYSSAQASDRTGTAPGWDNGSTVSAYVLDLVDGVKPAGASQVSRLLSHAATSTTIAAGASVNLVGVSPDSRLAYFMASDATKFGNGGTAFTDSASSASDIFAVDLSSRAIALVSGTGDASFGQAATFQGFGDDGSVLLSQGLVAGIASRDGTLTDPNGAGTDLLATRFNLLDLNTSDDSTETGTATDNITTRTNFTLNSIALPGRSVQLLDNGSVVSTQTTPASGLVNWSLSNVTIGEHNYSLQDTLEGVPLKPTNAAGAAGLKVTVIADTFAPNDPIINHVSSNDRTPDFRITAEAGSIVNVFDGQALLGQATETATPGLFTYTASELSAGMHQIFSRATDLAGNTSNLSSPWEVNLPA